MGRRKQKQLDEAKLAFSLLVTLGIIWVLIQILVQLERELIAFAIFIVAAVIIYWIAILLRRRNTDRALLQKSQVIIEQQIEPLTRRRAQLVWPDAYGILQMKKWEEEKDHFILHLIDPILSPRERVALQRDREIIVELIEEKVLSAAQCTPAFSSFSDKMSPSEFECFCAEELRRAGWNARVTKQSRDQGVDVVAEMNGIRVAIQCKLYGRPVGNKAVQEAAAARAHEKADYGAVATNNSYTYAAEQLASTNQILLLHYSELGNLHNLLLER